MSFQWKTGYDPEAIAEYRAELRFLRNEKQRLERRIDELSAIVGIGKWVDQ